MLPLARRRLARLAGAVLALAAPAAAQDAPPPPRPTVALVGLVQADFRLYPGDAGDAGTDGFLLRRARIEVGAQRGRLFALGEVDFGEGEVTLTDGYVGAEVGRGVRVQVGRFKAPFGLESLRSSSALRFAERALPTALSPRRDLGVMVRGVWNDERVEAAAGVFNGVPGGASESGDRSDAKDVLARVFVRPGGVLDGLGVGLAVATGAERGTPDDPAVPVVATPGDRDVFEPRSGVVSDGRRVRIGPQADLVTGPLLLVGEWTWAEQRVATGEGADVVIRQRAWQASAVWSLTGETQTRDRLQPRRPLGAGGLGAVEVGARVHGLRIADGAFGDAADPETQAAAVAAWGLTLVWTPVADARLSASL
ncbi:MAG TPA: porin, partial [Rubricoccaceae bacterium]